MTQFNWKSNTTKFGKYNLHPNLGATFWKSFFPYFTKKWNSLPGYTRNLSQVDFKSKLKFEFTPQKRRHFAYGSKLGNKLITRLRVGRSYLNSDSFAIGKVSSPTYMCHYPNETSKHYLLQWQHTMSKL